MSLVTQQHIFPRIERNKRKEEKVSQKKKPYFIFLSRPSLLFVYGCFPFLSSPSHFPSFLRLYFSLCFFSAPRWDYPSCFPDLRTPSLPFLLNFLAQYFPFITFSTLPPLLLTSHFTFMSLSSPCDFFPHSFTRFEPLLLGFSSLLFTLTLPNPISLRKSSSL